MLKLRTLVLAVASAALVSTLCADTFTENFAADPATRGWQTFGNASLFHWNSTNQNMEVTWDSSADNSYFYHPLGTTLTVSDAFSFSFDLVLNDATAGSQTNAPYTFEMAIGLLHLADAESPDFLRGTGYTSPNLVEFDYFPADGYGDQTVAATMFDTNNNSQFIYDPVSLVTGVTNHITLIHAAASPIVTGQVLTNGQPFSSLPDAFLSAGFGDFRLDAISINSYSGAGQDPSYAGSILAHGTVGNFSVTTPPPVSNVIGGFTNHVWQVQFSSATNWLYTLERTSTFAGWSSVSTAVPGTGATLILQDTNAPAEMAFYRVGASRP